MLALMSSSSKFDGMIGGVSKLFSVVAWACVGFVSRLLFGPHVCVFPGVELDLQWNGPSTRFNCTAYPFGARWCVVACVHLLSHLMSDAWHIVMVQHLSFLPIRYSLICNVWTKIIIKRICKHEKISHLSYHKIAYSIGGTYYSQESSDILPGVI